MDSLGSAEWNNGNTHIGLFHYNMAYTPHWGEVITSRGGPFKQFDKFLVAPFGDLFGSLGPLLVILISLGGAFAI